MIRYCSGARPAREDRPCRTCRPRNLFAMLNQSTLTRLMLICALVAASATGCSWFEKETTVHVPVLESAEAQYNYAVEYRDRRDLSLRDKGDMPALLELRDTVREIYQRVIDYFPEDRNVTPLARLQIADMQAGFDIAGMKVRKKDYEKAIDMLREIRGDYTEYEYVQAKARYDEALCLKAIRKFERAQSLFLEITELFRDSDDEFVRTLVNRASIQYRKTYVD